MHRTAPGTGEFTEDVKTGQNKLYNILKAYSQYDPEVGYVQGMNYIALMLLRYVPDEEDAFWCLVFVMQEQSWRDIFGRSKKNKLAHYLRDLEIYIGQTFPELHERITESDYLTMESTFTSHIITLFIYDAPPEIAVRIFELFLVDGAQVIVDLSASLIECQYGEMMRLDELDLMHYLRKDCI